MLELVGLDADADTAYAALLTGHPRTAADLIAATGLPPPQLRRALHTLQAHNRIRRRPGSPTRYVALDPGIALDLLLLEREEQIKRARALVLAYSEAFHQNAMQADAAPLRQHPVDHEAVGKPGTAASRSKEVAAARGVPAEAPVTAGTPRACRNQPIV